MIEVDNAIEQCFGKHCSGTVGTHKRPLIEGSYDRSSFDVEMFITVRLNQYDKQALEISIANAVARAFGNRIHIKSSEFYAADRAVLRGECLPTLFEVTPEGDVVETQTGEALSRRN